MAGQKLSFTDHGGGERQAKYQKQQSYELSQYLSF